MKNILTAAMILLALISQVGAQTAPNRSLLGTVASLTPETGDLEIKPDNAPPVVVKILNSSIIQRIAPGDTNLANAVAMSVSGIVTGDRVLITTAANSRDVLRIVVISASDIATRDEAERQDWNNRGINGIVAAKNGSQIVLRNRNLLGEIQQTITVTDKTKFRRYAPDSVRFAEAVASKLDEIAIGDQVRARGDKSADGLRVQAEEVVFGTFLTTAATVTAADAASRQVTVTELGTGKTLNVRLSPDSQIKQTPASPPRGGGAPTGGASIAQMVETMPAGQFEDIKPGTSIILSSTVGGRNEQVTAILILVNADPLIRMLTAQTARGGTLVFGASGGAGGIGALGIGP